MDENLTVYFWFSKELPFQLEVSVAREREQDRRPPRPVARNQTTGCRTCLTAGVLW